ncbi:hypothetical protein M8J77_006989 [Diaphorina citri]|nr:hypothetical protein M8J77_006989 [Diaphorina citri]
MRQGFIYFTCIYNIQTPGTGCPPPELSLNQTRVLARRNSTPDFRTFSEVKFTAQFPGPGFTHYTRLCKIKCINEKWVGPLCLDEDAEGKYEPILHGCQLGVIPSHLVVTYNNVTLHKEKKKKEEEGEEGEEEEGGGRGGGEDEEGEVRGGGGGGEEEEEEEE